MSDKATRSAFWASALFYGLIAFEFFYMFSPFAVYFYSVYGPGLKLLNFSASTSWLISFFMPHLARETTSVFINVHEAIGMVFFVVGITGFGVGAFKIYRNKLLDKGAVTGGIYRWIRHPQYLALMVASFGMVLIWPRYLVLFGFVTVCFAYVMLAKTEERICRRKFSNYNEYASQTGMFLPQFIERVFSAVPFPKHRYLRIISGITLYILSLVLSFGIAQAIHTKSVNSLYTYSTEREVYLSLGRLGKGQIRELARTAKSNIDVTDRLSAFSDDTARLINYVMPTELLVSEIPMHIPEGHVPTHESPGSKDQSQYKIIFTRAHFGPGGAANGINILRTAIHKSPIVEIWIDRTTNTVTRVISPPAERYYNSMPVPVF